MTTVTPSERDAAIAAKANELGKSNLAGWDIGAANAFVAFIGRAPLDEAIKADKGAYPSDGGFPCTAFAGRIVSLKHVNDAGAGSFAFIAK